MTNEMSTTVLTETMMKSKRREIPVSGMRGVSDLYRDFLESKSAVAEFYPHQDSQALATEIDSHSYPREELADILLEQNQIFGSQPATRANIELLRDKRTLVVFSGQQAGLFGGPLLSLYKAIWAVKEAARLSQQLGRPVIPIFWIAADDHDFEEINHNYVYDALSEPLQVSYYKSEQEGLPAYQRLLSNPGIYQEVKSSLTEAVGRTDFSEDILSSLFSAYEQGSDFVTAFGKFMASVTPDVGLIIFNPGDRKIKKLSGSFYHTLLDKRPNLKKTLRERNQQLSASGYHLQVEKEESATHIFILSPQRNHLHSEGDSYRLGERSYSETEMRKMIDDEPERFSPDVISRPLLAAQLFPTHTQAGGPSEIAYFAQLSGLYEVIDRPAPRFCGRVGATLIEKRFERLLEKHQLSVESFSGDVEDVVSEVLRESFPADLDQRFANLTAEFKEKFDELARGVVAFDKSLEANTGQVWGRIENALSGFQKKSFASHKRKMSDERAAIYRTANALYPLKSPQERVISVVYYLTRYGRPLVDFIWRNLQLDARNHQLLYLSELDDK